MSNENKSAAKLVDVAANVIEEQCETILVHGQSEPDLAGLSPDLRRDILSRFGPPSGPVNAIRAQLRELRRLAEKLRT